MTKLIPAIYERGAFKPVKHIKFPAHQRVLLAVAIAKDEIPSLLLSKLAEKSEGFDFLNNPQEDIYTPSEGEEI